MNTSEQQQYRRYVGQSNVAWLWIFGCIAVALLAAVGTADKVTLLYRLALVGGIVLICGALALAAVGYKLRDVLTVDPVTRTLHVQRKRVLLPDGHRDYSADDVRTVVIRRWASEGDDVFGAIVKLSDRRSVELTKFTSNRAAVEAAARSFLADIGREDMQMQYYWCEPLPAAETSATT